MERMINLARALDDERLIEKIEQLEEENKNLRAYADNLDSENDNQAIEIEELKKENKKLKEDVEFFRQCYLDLKKLCEDGGFLLPNEGIAKMFNLDEIK